MPRAAAADMEPRSAAHARAKVRQKWASQGAHRDDHPQRAGGLLAWRAARRGEGGIVAPLASPGCADKVESCSFHLNGLVWSALPPSRLGRARAALACIASQVSGLAAALDASRTRQRVEQISPLLAKMSAATRPAASVSVTRMPRAKFALLASSGSGSTWVNHMLSSHPCISSAGEYLLGNVSEQQVFRAPAGVSIVLDRIVEKVDEQLRCTSCSSQS